jgi:hypothetical protein
LGYESPLIEGGVPCGGGGQKAVEVAAIQRFETNVVA